jgi:hypothetical protein
MACSTLPNYIRVSIVEHLPLANTHSQSLAMRSNFRARRQVRRPPGAATGIPKDRRNSSDSGGSAAVKRAPDFRRRDSKSTPGGLAFVIPEMSTTSSLPARIDFAVFQACSRSCTGFPANSPRSTNWNIVALSCWYMSIGVYWLTSLRLPGGLEDFRNSVPAGLSARTR